MIAMTRLKMINLKRERKQVKSKRAKEKRGMTVMMIQMRIVIKKYKIQVQITRATMKAMRIAKMPRKNLKRVGIRKVEKN